MNEQDGVNKVAELATFLGQAKRLRVMGEAAESYLLKLAFVLIAVLFAFIVVRVAELYTGYVWVFERYTWMFAFMILFILWVGLSAGALYVELKLRSVHSTPPPSGGLPDALKYLSELDWEAAIEDVKKALVGLTIYALALLSAYWFGVYFLLYLADYVAYGYLYVKVDYGLLSLLSLLIAMALGRKRLLKQFRAVWSTDALIEELKWFYSEFKGAKFEA